MNMKIIESEIENIITQYLSGNTLKIISKKYNVNDSTIQRILIKNNIKRRTNSEAKRKYQINENYFDNIDSENKAYIIGLLYADGYNNVKRNNVRISLQQCDVDIIKFIKNEIYTNNDKPFGLTKKENYNDLIFLDITNKHISKRLSDLGVTQAKTFNITFPNWLNKNLYNHFIRGYFDGDGCLTHYLTGENKYFKCKFEIIGTENFCLDVSKIFGFNGNIEHVGEKNIVRYRLCGRQQILKVCSFLYEDATIFMERKFNKFKYIKNYERESI